MTLIGDRCWIRAVADGNEDQPVFSGTLNFGEERSFRGDQSLKITFGRIDAVRINVNGVDLGTPTGSGEVGTFVFYPDTKAFQRS